MITPQAFLSMLRSAFGTTLSQPIAVWRSGQAAGQAAQTTHCMLAVLPQVRAGQTVSFSKDLIRCGGGRFYAGYIPPNRGIAHFISQAEHYKDSVTRAMTYIDALGISQSQEQYLNLARIDQIASWDDVLGIFFLAEPDAMAGLCAWAYYDNNDAQAVSCRFASGCCGLISMMARPSAQHGRSVYLGMMDVSARPFVGRYEQSLAIPMPRLTEMMDTLSTCCLAEAPAWQRLRARIDDIPMS